MYLIILEPVLATKAKTSTPSQTDEPQHPKSPPPPSTSVLSSKNQRVLPEENTIRDVTLMNEAQQKFSRKSGILLTALNVVESEFFRCDNSDREVGILTIALNHLCKDVYRKPLSF